MVLGGELGNLKLPAQAAVSVAFILQGEEGDPVQAKPDPVAGFLGGENLHAGEQVMPGQIT